MNAERKTAANIIFRHMWYPIYPFYSSIIVIAAVSGVSAYALVPYGFPVTLVTVAFGYLFMIRGHDEVCKSHVGTNDHPTTGVSLIAARQVILSLAPVLLAISLALLAGVRFALALCLGILLALHKGLIQWPLHYRPGAYGVLLARSKVVWRRFRWQLLPLGASTLYLREVVASSEILDRLNAVIPGGSHWALPLSIAMAFFTGFFTGSNPVAAAINASLVLPTVPGDNKTAAVFLMFISGSVGYYASPFHLCLLLSREYFGARLMGIYSNLLVPLLLMLTTGIGVYLFTR